MGLIQAHMPESWSDTHGRLGHLPHVLLVVDQFPKALGGGERIVLRLAALLPVYGYRVSILTFAIHPECTGLEAAPCPVYVLPLTRTYDLTAMRGALELGRFLRRQEVRIVQTFFESSDLWAGLVTKAFSRAKLVWSRRDMGILRSPKHATAYRLMSGAPDAVMAVSEQVRRHAIEVDRIGADRVHTVYNGVDVSDWDANRAHTRDVDSVVVATVGNIRRVKGHDILLRAAAATRSRFPKVLFTIAGEVLEPEYFGELQELVRELDLSDHVRFVGGVKDLGHHLAGVDIFVLPSRSEGFSNAILEAMAASLPVIATDVGGNAEAVEDGVSGLIVPAESAEALAGAMTQMLEDPSRATAMGMAGRRLLVERFTVGAMMDRTTKIYGDLIGDRGALPVRVSRESV